MIAEMILRKRWLRSDDIWTRSFVYKSFLRHIPLFLDTYALMKSQYWPRERLARLQERRLHELFRDAQRVSFWKDMFLAAEVTDTMSAREVLARLPITSKKELNEAAEEDIQDASLIGKSDADHTSGSTGKPFHFYQDRHATMRSWAITERTFRTVAAGKRLPIVYMRRKERHGFTFYKHVWFYLDGFTAIRSRMEDFKRLGELLSDGFILYGYTSWVVELAQLMEAWGMKLPIKAVVVAGEHLNPADHEYIERIMDARLSELYASREVGFLGYECEEHRLHINEEWALIEIVDEEGVTLPPGKEGRIAVTALDNRVMPFIRYDIGDIGVISDTPCACGRTLRTLSFKGRVAELIELDEDHTVTLLDIAYGLGTYRDAIRQYQIVQTGKLAFTFRIISGPLFEEKKETLEKLMKRLLHPDAQIRWEMVDEIPQAKSGKALYFIRDIAKR